MQWPHGFVYRICKRPQHTFHVTCFLCHVTRNWRGVGSFESTENLDTRGFGALMENELEYRLSHLRIKLHNKFHECENLFLSCISFLVFYIFIYFFFMGNQDVKINLLSELGLCWKVFVGDGQPSVAKQPPDEFDWITELLNTLSTKMALRQSLAEPRKNRNYSELLFVSCLVYIHCLTNSSNQQLTISHLISNSISTFCCFSTNTLN